MSMKKLFLFLLCYTLFISSQCCQKNINAYETIADTITDTIADNKQLLHAIVDENNHPTPSLLQLFNAMHITHDNTLETILAHTKKWLRPSGQERWENQKTFSYTYDELSRIFTKLCLVQKINPSYQEYTYSLLFGGCLSDVRNRLYHLIQAWQMGIRFATIVVLTGKRLLDERIENANTMIHVPCATLSWKKNWHHVGQVPTTETEMIKLIFDQTETPKEWETMPISFVDTPTQHAEDGTVRRPNTLDTIAWWMTTDKPQPGSILAISNQPFVGYQNSVLRSVLSKNFLIDTVGDEIDANNRTVATILDSLARWIYVEYQMRKMHTHTRHSKL